MYRPQFVHPFIHWRTKIPLQRASVRKSTVFREPQRRPWSQALLFFKKHPCHSVISWRTLVQELLLVLFSFFYLLIKGRIKESSALKCLMIWSFSNWREIEKVTGLVSFYYTCQERINSCYEGFLLLLRPGPWGLEKMATIITLILQPGLCSLGGGEGDDFLQTKYTHLGSVFLANAANVSGVCLSFSLPFSLAL